MKPTRSLARAGGGEIVLGNVQEESGELIFACAGPRGLRPFSPDLHNAKLIAAAPELLRMCMDYYEYVVSLRELKFVEGPSIDNRIQEAATLILRLTK